MLQGELQDHIFCYLVSVDDLLSELDPCFLEDLAYIEKHLPAETDKTAIGRDRLLDLLKCDPELCFRLAKILNHLYLDALQRIKSQ